MFSVVPTRRFKRDLKRLSRQHKDIDKLETVVDLIAQRKTLSPRNRDHALTGSWKDHRDCHIEPDWLLIYRVNKEEETIVLTRSGSHAELLKS